MDQESFRRLLQNPRTGGSSALGSASSSRGSLLAPPKKKVAEDASQPAFKPRTVKKKAQDTKLSKYRDRAAERRVGDGNDYAHIEAVLEDFEKKNMDEDRAKVEEQRKYLGGDSEHSILVKGLDFALLEQNKSRAIMTNEDVDALDQVFLESSSHSTTTVPKKRTREELLRELKEQRIGGKSSTKGPNVSAEEEARLLEQAKQKGKFKPIGQSDAKNKKSSRLDGVEGEKKKKKRKVSKEDSTSSKINTPMERNPLPSAPITVAAPDSSVQEDIIDEDYDIFVDVGDYEGIDVDDEDDGVEIGPTKSKSTNDTKLAEVTASLIDTPKRWIDMDEPELPIQSTIPLPTVASKQETSSRSSPSRVGYVSDDEEMDQPVRLVPLSSSALPSIKEFLAMDQAASFRDKKKKRKDRKNDGEVNGAEDSKKTLEAKVDRDYQRLKTYTDKRGAAENK